MARGLLSKPTMPASLRRLAMVLALALGTLAGCDVEDPDSELEVLVFEDGVAKDTEGGAFRVSLYSHGGLEAGPNDLIVRVGFHDPSDPLAPGFGIPSAHVTLDAYARDGDAQVLDLEGVHIGDGRYEIADLELAEPGVWEFEIHVEVGATLDELVEFAFEIDD